MSRPRAGSTPAVRADFLAELRPALRALLRAWQFAQDVAESPWEFAVEIQSLYDVGLTDNDLRWLLRKNYVAHAPEVFKPGEPLRAFGRPGRRFTERTCFVLTAAGAESFLQLDAAAHIPSPVRIHAPPRGKPTWDAARRELRYQNQIVKQFRVPAGNQERILAAFQEEGWPPCIDDPLPPADELDPKRRLNAAIQSLNRRQLLPLLHFRGNGEADGVLWEALDET